MFILWLFMGSAVVSYILYLEFRIQARTIADVIAVARKVDAAELAEILDPQKETNLRESMAAADFRAEQKIQLRILCEYLRRMGFNAMLVLSWAYAEQQRAYRCGTEDDGRMRSIEEAIMAGTRFRFYFVCTLPKVLLRLLLSRCPLLVINKCDLREIGERDGITLYRQLVNAAASLAGLHGDKMQGQVTAALGAF